MELILKKKQQKHFKFIKEFSKFITEEIYMPIPNIERYDKLFNDLIEDLENNVNFLQSGEYSSKQLSISYQDFRNTNLIYIMFEFDNIERILKEQIYAYRQVFTISQQISEISQEFLNSVQGINFNIVRKKDMNTFIHQHLKHLDNTLTFLISNVSTKQSLEALDNIRNCKTYLKNFQNEQERYIIMQDYPLFSTSNMKLYSEYQNIYFGDGIMNKLFKVLVDCEITLLTFQFDFFNFLSELIFLGHSIFYIIVEGEERYEIENLFTRFKYTLFEFEKENNFF